MNIANDAGRSFGALLALALAVLSAPGQADDAIHLDFMTHASFFSAETHQAAQDVTQVRERAPPKAASATVPKAGNASDRETILEIRLSSELIYDKGQRGRGPH